MAEGGKELVEPGLPGRERGDSGDDAEVAERATGCLRETGGHRGHAGAAVTTAAHFRPARFQALLADSTLTATSAAPGTVSSGDERWRREAPAGRGSRR